MNETEKQVMGELQAQRQRFASLEDRVAQLADRLAVRLDRQGSVLDRLVAIQEDRNQHQDALEHIQGQNTRRIQDASNRLKELDERLDAIADRHALLEERQALLEGVWKNNEQQIAIIQRKQEEGPF